MKIFNTISLFFILLLFTFSSCDNDAEEALEIKKGFLTAHTWKYERWGIVGGPKNISFPDERFKYMADGSYLKTYVDKDGKEHNSNGNWKFNKDASRLTHTQDNVSGTFIVRELTSTSLKLTRDDTPGMTVEFDLIPLL